MVTPARHAAGATQTDFRNQTGACAAWIFLISAEAIASTTGLGYRIFLVRRYLAMDVILPYVVWITFACLPAGPVALDDIPACLPLESHWGASTMSSAH